MWNKIKSAGDNKNPNKKIRSLPTGKYREIGSGDAGLAQKIFSDQDIHPNNKYCDNDDQRREYPGESNYYTLLIIFNEINVFFC